MIIIILLYLFIIIIIIIVIIIIIINFFSNCYSIFSRAVGVNVEAMDAYSWPTPGP